MGKLRRFKGFAQHYIDEVAARVVAASGRPGDRYHLGKLILQGLHDAPEFVSQIDAGTGKSETAGSVLERSVRCATCFRTLGLGCGDVIVTMAPNHIDLCVPFYAALYLGITVSPIDWVLGVKECATLLDISRPKLIFCQSDKHSHIQEATKLINLDATIITFDENDNSISFKKFHEKYEKPTTVAEFRAADFDTDENVAFFVSTSGTTGLPKAAANTHKNIAVNLCYWMCLFESFPTPTRMDMVVSPLQWISAIDMFLLSPILRFIRLQTSSTITPEHALQMIRKYKPTYAVMSPTFLTLLMKSENREDGDLSSFEVILVGGSTVTEDVINNLKAISPDTHLLPGYGMSEIGVTHLADGSQQNKALIPMSLIKCRLVDPTTGLDIEEPNVPGELCMTGPSLFKGYHNRPKETAETMSEDGWLKTGDIFYRDENGSYFFVERYKMVLKYRGHQISPVEVEAVIRQHPSVLDAAVTGIPVDESGELLVACVVRKRNCDVTAQEIQELVKDSLADFKQLRGGVIFLDELPMTASSKIHRKKLRDIALCNKGILGIFG